MTKYLLGLVVLASSLGCDAFMRDWQRDRVLSHLSKLNNYHGIMTETGVLDSGAELTSEIWFERPGKYRVNITAPEAHAGTQMLFDEKTLQLYVPKLKFAVVYKNLPVLTEGEAKKIIEDQFRSGMNAFVYELGTTSKMARHAVVELGFVSRDKNFLVTKGKSQVFDDYSFPLASEMNFKNGTKYCYRFKEIQFNQKSQALKFEFSLPTDTIVSDWDMNSKSLTVKEAQTAANFKFEIPRDIPQGLHLEKVIRQKGPIPAFTAVYQNRPYFLYVIFSQNFDTGGSSARGLKVAAGNKLGRLIPNPHLSSYSFVEKGTQYVLIGNIPMDEIISTAASIGSAQK